ncbi:MAG: hypothetical protein AAF604_02175 [Acidobacteriota bacterium]
MRAVLPVLIALALMLSAGSSASAQLLFADAFDSGDLSAWTSFLSVPERVYRFDDLDLRDPHLFVDAGPFGCLDVTDGPVPFDIAPAFNELVATALGGDGDGDGFLDLNPLLIFRPFDLGAKAARLNFDPGRCDAPPDPLSCFQVSGGSAADYDGEEFGPATCLEVVTGTTGGYSPAIAEPTNPCFSSRPRTLFLEVQGINVPLQEGRIGATTVFAGTETLADGLLSGFLLQSDADAITLPADFPIVGGQPLSVLLPGGTGNCAAVSDLDSLDGDDGWWFYFNFTAAELDLFTGF